VAAGTVTEAQRKGGNGLYVKIRHDKMYETQYLHMSKLGGGIHAGTRVAQGQTIGYVGSSGLATGPHVCFRFWKHGKQVNHLKENFPDPDPMSKEDLPKFLEFESREHRTFIDSFCFAGQQHGFLFTWFYVSYQIIILGYL
jgi:murein DD-endopeptidase MepM/ murein hydrolase activator NlpD